MKKSLYGSIVWLLVTLFVVYSFCLNTAAAVFSDAIKNSLQLNPMGVTLAFSSFIAGFACMQIPAGYLLDKYNARYVVSSGVLLLALGNILISLSPNLFFFCAANFIQGIGAAFSFIAAAKLISQWFAAKLFPILFGFTQTLSCILAGIIHFIFMIELKTYSWNQLYQTMAVVGLSLFVLTLAIVKNPADVKSPKNLSLKKSLATVCKHSQIWLCSIAAATSFGVLLVYASFWYAPIQTFYAVSTLDAAIISGIVFLGIGIGTPFFGWMSNRVKSRKMVLHLTLVLGTMALLLGIYLPHFNIGTLVIIKAISFFIGFFLSGSMLFYTVVSEISSDDTRGVALSITNTSIFLFNVVLMFIPLVFITTQSSTFFTILWILPFCTMISMMLLYFIKETYST